MQSLKNYVFALIFYLKLIYVTSKKAMMTELFINGILLKETENLEPFPYTMILS